MLRAAIGSLIIAWFLSLFGFDTIFIKATKELFGVDATMSSYYFVFFLLGCITGIFQLRRS